MFTRVTVRNTDHTVGQLAGQVPFLQIKHEQNAGENPSEPSKLTHPGSSSWTYDVPKIANRTIMASSCGRVTDILIPPSADILPARAPLVTNPSRGPPAECAIGGCTFAMPGPLGLLSILTAFAPLFR